MPKLTRRSMLGLIGLGLAPLSARTMALTGVAEAGQSGGQQLAATVALSPSASERIAAFITRTRYEDLPPEVVLKAKEQLIYHFGVAFSGCFTEEAETMRTVLRRMTQRDGATVIGERWRLLPSDAAFANCNLMRATWRDDVVWPAGIHAGLMTLPTALAIGETKRLSGREMLVAIVIGYEVLGKLGQAAQGWEAPFPRRPTMIYGAYGPISVAGRLLKLDQQIMANALGYAANLGMGVPEGGQTEHFYGLLSRNATIAAQLAELGGAPYSRSTIEGSAGLFQSYFGTVPAQLPRLLDQLGSGWELLNAAQKRYPGTSQNTVATELFLNLVTEQRLVADQVADIEVHVSFADESDERKNEITFQGPFRDWTDAYSSLPYALAIALIDRKVSPARFRGLEVLNDRAVASTMKKIDIAFETGHGAARYCRLRVRMNDGREYLRESTNSNIGENFSFPFPASSWAAWLQEDGERLLPASQVGRLRELIGNLEDVDDVSQLMQCVVPASV